MYEWNEDEPRIVLVLATEGFYSTRVLMLLLGAVVAIICHFAVFCGGEEDLGARLAEEAFLRGRPGLFLVDRQVWCDGTLFWLDFRRSREFAHRHPLQLALQSGRFLQADRVSVEKRLRNQDILNIANNAV